MYNVAIIPNRVINGQRVNNIENNKVLVPFNINKTLVSKLEGLLNKIKIAFAIENDKLNIGNLEFNGIIVKPSQREFSISKMTLSKTYVVTMKNILAKVNSFYDRVIENSPKIVADISRETNLQKALQEATIEINLSELNASLATENKLPEEPKLEVVPENINNNPQVMVAQEQQKQVLANDMLGEKIIQNPITPNNEQPVVVPNVGQENVNNSVNNANVNNQPTVETQPQNNIIQATVTPEAPASKPKRRFLARKGNILAIPIVIIWLGLVLFGTIKLVTSILT